jgi:hypothetical protein
VQPLWTHRQKYSELNRHDGTNITLRCVTKAVTRLRVVYVTNSGIVHETYSANSFVRMRVATLPSRLHVFCALSRPTTDTIQCTPAGSLSFQTNPTECARSRLPNWCDILEDLTDNVTLEHAPGYPRETIPLAIVTCSAKHRLVKQQYLL